MVQTTAAQLILQAATQHGGKELPPEYWELIGRYRGILMNQAMSMLGNTEDAEDVVQETFCEAFRQGEKLAQVRSLGAWLCTINRAHALNKLKDRKRRLNGMDRKQQDLPSRMHTTGGLSLVEMRESVAKAIEQLPVKLRDAVDLRYWEHLSFEEIARRLKVPAGTSRRIVWEGVNLLHEKLDSLHQNSRAIAEDSASTAAAPPSLKEHQEPSTSELRT